MSRIKNICILILLIFLSCNTSSHRDNEAIIQYVDQTPINKKIIELNVDSNYQILDTLRVIEQKLSSDDILRWQNFIYYDEKVKSVQRYYDKEGELFLQLVFGNKNDTIAMFKTFNFVNREIDYAVHYDKSFNNEFDTLELKYSYDYYNNKEIDKIRIEVVDQNNEMITTIKNDQNGNPLFEMTIADKDTLQIQRWIYENNKLVRSNFISNQIDQQEIYYYDSMEVLIREEVFDISNSPPILKQKSSHFYQESNDRSLSKTYFPLTDSTSYIKYEIELIK